MATATRKKIRLGDLLVEHKVISEAQLQQALSDQKSSGRKLGKVLIENGFVAEERMLQFLSQQLQIPFVDLKFFKYKADIARKLPETHARRYRAIPLDEGPDNITVGMADPTDIFGFDELAKILKTDIKLALVREADLLQVIDNVYRRTEAITSFAEELGQELSTNDIDLAQMIESEETTDAPVVKLLQSIFEDAVQVGASDIHIEPDDTVLRIRQRIDGVLNETIMNDRRIAAAVVSRLKLMAGLNISEKRLPQDGRFNIRVNKKSIDVRLSTMPVEHGESVVMRLLDQSGGTLELSQLGMPENILGQFESLIRRPHGMVLVTGPTGSGKTTTLYAALNLLNKPESKIITVEDPVEYRLPRINQVQVNTQIGLTFARVLRTALRQDPDIVLVGEMRDQETAEIGLRAAITGHMVMSTLHTNDAISTAIRLIDMGAEGYLIASALKAVLAQRLVRKVCESCVTDHPLDATEQAWVKSIGDRDYSNATFKQGTGCPQCNNTGYHGRVGVYELLYIDTELGDALRSDDALLFARRARQQKGFRTLSQLALDYASQGITTVEEVIRISGDIEEFDNSDLQQATATSSPPAIDET